jgi:SAM-dependent methyltransferase
MSWNLSSPEDTVALALHCANKDDFAILDAGCGGGRAVKRLAAIATDGMVYRIDYAEGSVAASRAQNGQRLMKAGRVAIEKASVSLLPFADRKVGLATAAETQCYWPNLVGDVRERLPVLKSGQDLRTLRSLKDNEKGWICGKASNALAPALVPRPVLDLPQIQLQPEPRTPE